MIRDRGGRLLAGLGVLLGTLALAASGSADEAAAGPFQGPVGVRDYFLLSLPFLVLEPDTPVIAQGQQWRLEVIGTVTNTHALSGGVEDALKARDVRAPFTVEDLLALPERSRGGGEFLADGELFRTVFRLYRGVGASWQFGLEIPFYAHEGGFLDSPIENFHSVFALEQAGRTGLIRNGYAVLINSKRGLVAIENDPSSGFGDIVLSAKARIPESVDWLDLAVKTSVKAPTGNQGSLLSSGSADVAVQVIGGACFGSSCFYLGAGLAALGRSTELLTPSQTILSANGAYELAISPSLSFLAEGSVSESPLEDHGVRRLTKETWLITLGLKVKASGAGDLFFGLTENFGTFSNGADLGLHAGWIQRF